MRDIETPGQFFAENLCGSFFAENLHGSIFRRKFEWYLFRRKFVWFIFRRKFEWFIICRKSDAGDFDRMGMKTCSFKHWIAKKRLHDDIAHLRSNWEFLRNILSSNLTYIQTMYFVFRLFTAIYACAWRIYLQLTLWNWRSIS